MVSYIRWEQPVYKRRIFLCLPCSDTIDQEVYIYAILAKETYAGNSATAVRKRKVIFLLRFIVCE